MPEHYKSWSALKKRLEECLCSALKGRITYFLTYYHKVHNSYGRASVRLDGQEQVCFSWIERCHQEDAVSELHKIEPHLLYSEAKDLLKPKWDIDCSYDDYNFVNAVTDFLNLSIGEAQKSEDYIIKILAVLDKRTGKRVLKQIKDAGIYSEYPEWVILFYELRFNVDNI